MFFWLMFTFFTSNGKTLSASLKHLLLTHLINLFEPFVIRLARNKRSKGGLLENYLLAIQRSQCLALSNLEILIGC